MKNAFGFINFLVFSSILLLCANRAIAAKDYGNVGTTYIFLNSAAMGAGLSQDFNFPPNVPQKFSNPLFWGITATCTITSENSASVSAKAIKKTSRVNGIELSPNQDEVLFYVNNTDKLTITADSGAEVQLINLGEENLQAHCSI